MILKILGLDIGTNSIGWALISQNFEKKDGEILDVGSRILPMDQSQLTDFEKGNTVSATAQRTAYRGVRRLYQRDNLRRERLHRILKILGFLPEHYQAKIDFEKKKGQFVEEVKLNYKKNEAGNYEFIFMDSFKEMVNEFKNKGFDKIPFDWTLYYLRKKALKEKISKKELAWIILNFNQKRGYYQLRGEEKEENPNKLVEFLPLKVIDVKPNIKYELTLENNEVYTRTSETSLLEWKNTNHDFIVTTYLDKDGTVKKDKEGKEKRSLLLKEDIDVIKKKYRLIKNIKIKTEEQSLRITDVKEIKEDEIWYSLRLENDWIYRRKSKTDLSGWKDKVRDFIITTDLEDDGTIKTDKEGNPKRSFRAPKEDDWTLIKKKTEQDLDNYIVQNDKHTVGTYIYETLLSTPNQKIRGKLIKTIERKYYKEELKKILDLQIEKHAELQNDVLYKACIEELYPRNEAHQNSLLTNKNKIKHLIVEDIIFYQRPLKSQKGNISGCQYEKRPQRDKEGNLLKDESGKTVLKPIKVTSKSNPVFQEFRLWQWLHNLKIYQNQKEENGSIKIDVDVTEDLLPTEKDWVKLFNFLTTKKEIDLPGFLKYFSDKSLIEKQKKDNFTHRWNYPEDKKYPMYETRYSILSRLKKVEGLKNPTDFLTPEIEKHLWHIVYSVSDAKEFEKALSSFAKKYGLNNESFVKNFTKIPPYKNDYASYSEKAIKKLLPLMRLGKYWKESAISNEVKERINSFMERVKSLHLPENPTPKEINTVFDTHQVTDDDINKQMIKSFIPLKDKNPFKGLNTYQAGYAVYGRHSESGDILTWKTPQDINAFLQKFKQHSLRNPIVEQVVLETLRTVRDIWNYYGEGKEGFFDEIHLELGRNLKNPAEKRKKMSQRNSENERTNQRIRSLLNELTNDGAKPHSPSHQEILKIYEEDVVTAVEIPDDILKIRKNNTPSNGDIKKYKLWLEQKYISPYTGKHISLSELFTDKYQIEHIIPQSRYFDNSMSNKVICESAVNQLKSNQTAYEFIKDKGGTKVALGNGKNVDILTFEKYEAHCNSYFKKNKQKLKNLLTEVIPEGFINRQLNDSRYISKLVKSLLSNIVREENEQEVTSKKLLPVTGAITSKLKQDWGLNDKWNELILPRFKRLNQLTNTQDFTYLNDQNIEVPTVPDNLKTGFSKKRIDHRHHALDALVIACCTRKHIQYINSLNNEKEKYDLQPSLMIKNKEGDFTKHFQLPWQSFPADAKNTLEKTVVSFKKNTRILTKTNNKYWKYVKQKDGSYKKKLVKQKGVNRAIRKPLHKETIFGKLKWKAGKGKIYAASRVSLIDFKEKQIESITDKGIQQILRNHLKQEKYQNQINEKGKPISAETLAFSAEGIEDLNKNIKILNGGKNHHPIYKVRKYEESSKFPVSENINSPKNKKYVEAAKGTNLFFNIYKNQKGERVYETVPLNEVIAHQKWRASLPKKERENTPMVPVKKVIKNKEVSFLFSLSPNDLVYVPTDEELNNPNLVNFENLSSEQINRIYKMVSSSGNQCFFIKSEVAKSIYNKKEYSALNKMEKSIDNIMIKTRCLKLKTDRLGKSKVIG